VQTPDMGPAFSLLCTSVASNKRNRVRHPGLSGALGFVVTEVYICRLARLLRCGFVMRPVFCFETTLLTPHRICRGQCKSPNKFLNCALRRPREMGELDRAGTAKGHSKRQ
jgi:hypothetical protein